MYVIGADMGTSGAKAILMNEQGRVLAQSSCPYGLHCPGEGMVEQDARDWWQALVKIVRDILPEDPENVAALALSTQAGTTVPVDEKGQPLCHAITWMDARSLSQAEAFRRNQSDEIWYRDTGVVPSTSYSMAHTAWWRDEHPEIYKKAWKFLTTPDYLHYHLTGRAVIDPTNTSMTNWLDLSRSDWYDFGLAQSGLTRDRVAEMQPTGSLVGTLTEKAARELGLSCHVRVYNAMHDQYAAATGCGAVQPGDFMMSCGTAWVLLGAFPQMVRDESLLLVPGKHVLPDVYGAFYSISVGSASLDWLMRAWDMPKSELGPVNEICAQRAETGESPLFYPYLQGSSAIDHSRSSRGVFAGLTLAHDKYDMLLAVMEGVAFEVRRAVEVFEKAGCPVQRMQMLGGAAKSDLWARILASVTGRPVWRGGRIEAACAGAAIVAAAGCGMFESIEAGCRLCHADDVCMEPDPVWRQRYDAKFARYMQGVEAVLKL